MAENISRSILFKSQSSTASGPANMSIIAYSPQEQKMRALKALLTFWAIGAVCILIPIAHFILVPGFLIGGIIAANRRWKAVEEGVDASGGCPSCGEQITLSLDKNPELPQWHNCPQCSAPLELQRSEQSA